MRKKLPIGIQTFSKLRETNCVYVDKTQVALRLIENGSYYFLSRPRRFGKSLFLDTLREIFKGTRELFKDLYIYDKWDWTESSPVVKVSFGAGSFSTEEGIKKRINEIIEDNCERNGIDADTISSLAKLLKVLYRVTGRKVVLLIDEYDKPILDNITDKARSATARSVLRDFYGSIKECDEYIRFVFITGVSKFSKMNLFSGLNNLEDITVDKHYATITGYTHDDLKTYFEDYLGDVNLEMVKKWYNGYNYFGDPIYNPFDILLFLSKGCRFSNYWWSSGNPSFLIELLKSQPKHYIPELENTLVEETVLDTFDVEYIDLIALLWQTGYLTFAEEIVDETTFKIRYRMKLPNLEIQNSLNTLFLDYLTDLKSESTRIQLETADALRDWNPDALNASLKRLFSAIPYANYANNIIAKYEGYYSSVLFTHIASIGYDIVPEDYTNRGRIDMTVMVKDNIFIFEFKVDSEEPAIKQIKEKRYHEKYMAEGKNVYLLGINFSSKERNITEFQWECAEKR